MYLKHTTNGNILTIASVNEGLRLSFFVVKAIQCPSSSFQAITLPVLFYSIKQCLKNEVSNLGHYHGTLETEHPPLRKCRPADEL
jgi:hypothetical protein